MGGPGSGNRVHAHRRRKRLTVEAVLTLPASILRRDADREGWKRWSCRDGRTVGVRYRIDHYRRVMELCHDWDMAEYTIELSSREQPRGGLRWEFVCPHCDLPCARLHCPPWQQTFRCRVCSKLTYRSCQESGWRWAGLARILADERGPCAPYHPRPLPR